MVRLHQWFGWLVVVCHSPFVLCKPICHLGAYVRTMRYSVKINCQRSAVKRLWAPFDGLECWPGCGSSSSSSSIVQGGMSRVMRQQIRIWEVVAVHADDRAVRCVFVFTFLFTLGAVPLVGGHSEVQRVDNFGNQCAGHALPRTSSAAHTYNKPSVQTGCAGASLRKRTRPRKQIDCEGPHKPCKQFCGYRVGPSNAVYCDANRTDYAANRINTIAVAFFLVTEHLPPDVPVELLVCLL